MLGFTPLALFLRHSAKRLLRLPLSPVGRAPLHLGESVPTRHRGGGASVGAVHLRFSTPRSFKLRHHSTFLSHTDIVVLEMTSEKLMTNRKH